MPANLKSGFTLVEIMVVVVIIGLLAAIAVPAYLRVKSQSENSRLASDIRTLSGLIETFTLDTGDYPEDSSSGVIPTGLDQYIKTGFWHQGPSIGGVWDVEKDSHSIASAVGVHRYTITNEQLQNFDTTFDDGDLTTGSYRKLAGDRYYYVVAE